MDRLVENAQEKDEARYGRTVDMANEIIGRLTKEKKELENEVEDLEKECEELEDRVEVVNLARY